MRSVAFQPIQRQSARPSVARSTRSTSVTRVQASKGNVNFGSALAATVLAGSLLASSASAKLEGVNRPDLLPSGDVVTVIDVAGFLTPSEEARIKLRIKNLEADTGFRLRLLAQSYPETPGLAVRDYWKVDDQSVVFVADPTFANILNFNVGGNVDLEVPQSFWSRLSGKFGNKFYWQEKGEAASILQAVNAIDACLREEPGRFKCNSVQEDLQYVDN
eukprot:gene16061-22198_t